MPLANIVKTPSINRGKAKNRYSVINPTRSGQCGSKVSGHFCVAPGAKTKKTM